MVVEARLDTRAYTPIEVDWMTQLDTIARGYDILNRQLLTHEPMVFDKLANGTPLKDADDKPFTIVADQKFLFGVWLAQRSRREDLMDIGLGKVADDIVNRYLPK